MNLQVAHEGPIAVITLNRPERRNALSLELMQDLIAALEEIGRNRDDSIFGQLVAHTAQPVSQTKNFLNDQHGRGFVFTLRINDEGFDRVVARLDIDPFAVAWRIVQTILAEIFVLLCGKRLSPVASKNDSYDQSQPAGQSRITIKPIHRR